MNFYIIRLSFRNLVQKKLSKKDFSVTKMELVEKLLQENYEYTRKSTKGYVDFHLGNFKSEKNEKEETFNFATLGKYRVSEAKKFDAEEVEHYKELIVSSPWVNLLIDREEQVFIIEKNSSVFSNYNSLFNSIEDHLNSLLHEYDLSVSIAPITSTINFWKRISEYDYIYTVNFELFMPNLFGNTNKSAKNILSDVKEKHNADKLSEQISNEEGALNLSESDDGINNWLDWIGKGGGKWFIRCKKGTSKRKNKITSAKEAQAFSTSEDIGDIGNEKALLNSIQMIIKELKSYYLTQYLNNDEHNENN